MKPIWHPETDTDLDCQLCGERDTEEGYCYGCEVVICEEHVGAPIGSHVPEDHENDGLNPYDPWGDVD